MKHPAPISPVEVSAKTKAKTNSNPESWGPVKAILVTIGLYFASQLMATVVMGAVGYALGHKDVGSWLADSIAGQFGFFVVAESLVLGILWQIVKRYPKALQQIGFKRGPSLGDIGYVLGAYVIYFVVFIIITVTAQHIAPSLNTEQKQDIGFTSAHGWSLILVFMSLVVLPPVTEEILFRGFLYRGLRKALPLGLAVLFTSLLFGAAHLQFGNDKPLLWIAALDTFSLSLVLIWLREKTANLWASIGLHMLKNGIAFFVLFILPMLQTGTAR